MLRIHISFEPGFLGRIGRALCRRSFHARPDDVNPRLVKGWACARGCGVYVLAPRGTQPAPSRRAAGGSK